MTTQTEPELGYAFEPPSPPGHLAHRRLTVWLRREPTLRHYDPEKLEAPVVTMLGDLDTAAIFHPWAAGHAYRAVAGRVILTDRTGKKVEAFTFGGALRIDGGLHADTVVGVLTSPAPILPLAAGEPLAGTLAAEVEGLLARRRAVWDTRGQGQVFDERLAATPPLGLYLACLKALKAEAEARHGPRSMREHQHHHFLEAELRAQREAGHAAPELEAVL